MGRFDHPYRVGCAALVAGGARRFSHPLLAELNFASQVGFSV